MNFIQTILNHFIVYAAVDNELKLDSSLKPILTGVIGISTCLAVLSFAICIIRYMTAEDGSSIAAAKKDAITVAIAWVILNSVGLFIAAAFELISNINI